MEYIPRNQLVAYLKKGWRLIPNHEYDVNEYAILMSPSDKCYPELSRIAIAAIESRFTDNKAKPIRMSNLQRAAISRDFVS